MPDPGRGGTTLWCRAAHRLGVSSPYTKADIPNAWVNAPRLAFFASAFEGTAVVANSVLPFIVFNRGICSLREARSSKRRKANESGYAYFSFS
jgi:hypothetical protein